MRGGIRNVALLAPCRDSAVLWSVEFPNTTGLRNKKGRASLHPKLSTRASCMAMLGTIVIVIVMTGILAQGTASATAARVPLGVRKDEQLRFSRFVQFLGIGENPGELAVGFGYPARNTELVANGRVIRSLHVGSLQWIPQSNWTFVDTSPGQQESLKEVVSASTGQVGFTVPGSCWQRAPLPVALSEHAIAFFCGVELHVVNVTQLSPHFAGAGQTVYRFPRKSFAPIYSGASVNPTGTLAAVSGLQPGVTGVRIYRLDNHAAYALRGVFPIGSYPLSWLSQDVVGVLSLLSGRGIYVWHVGGEAIRLSVPLPTTASVAAFQPESGGKTALLLLKNPGVGPGVYTLYRVWANGKSKEVMSGRWGYVLALDALHGLIWREEGVAASIYACGNAKCGGSGPFRLEAIPVPQG